MTTPDTSVRKVYMHTIDGFPAKYVEGEQIVYLNNRMKNVLRSSIAEIKADQVASLTWRRKRGFSDNARYGSRMFYV